MRISLTKQVCMYSVDTSYFYNEYEQKLEQDRFELKREILELKDQLNSLENAPIQSEYDDSEAAQRNDDSPDTLENKHVQIESEIKEKQVQAKSLKKTLVEYMTTQATANIAYAKKEPEKINCRELNTSLLKDNDIVSVFESALTRTLKIEPDYLTDELIIVQIYFQEVFKDICYFGFVYKDQKYKYLTSSAGQIRKKKAVFIKESTWSRIEKTLMCGLTTEKINSKGGNNVNKHLAYMALTNSATDLWQDFDIDRTIVIDDFETNVLGEVDYIDDGTYEVERRTMEVPVPHTDGVGMVLPDLLKKNAMFRAPWIKGLLASFDFRKFVTEKGYDATIKDIYGNTHDIFQEDIQIIFTKSQFKMHKYYDSWDEYKKMYKKHHCTAGLCNIERDKIKNAKINYQMLQTLTDISEDEINTLVEKSKVRIEKICKSQKTMMEILGATTHNENKTYFQRALSIYPALLNDTYAKDVLRSVKNSLLKKYRSGKLEVSGKYTFVIPDLYAACEYWFWGIKTPGGLLADQEIYCSMFPKSEKLDCLRSPHLYKEHAVRNNVAHQKYKSRHEEIQKWFVTKAVYTSTHDLISKFLMFDCDGDMLLLIADLIFIEIAERNMREVVPLFYNMRKAESQKLNSETIFNGLHAAFNGGNIGMYSNAISKIWNNSIFTKGSPDEKAEAIKVIKLLCMENNFVIDYAKTLYKPTTPNSDVKNMISKYTGEKLPAFFEFAKDKTKNQLKERGGTFVDRIYEKIKDVKINTRKLNLDTIDYKKMMYDVNTTCAPEVAELYNKLNREYRYMINMKDETEDNLHHLGKSIRDEMSKTGFSSVKIADMLVQYLYQTKVDCSNAPYIHPDKRDNIHGSAKTKRAQEHKHILWFCYGDHIVDNLMRNVKLKRKNIIQCADCGEWIEVDDLATEVRRCETCQIIYRRKRDRDRKQKVNSAWPQ